MGPCHWSNALLGEVRNTAGVAVRRRLKQSEVAQECVFTGKRFNGLGATDPFALYRAAKMRFLADCLGRSGPVCRILSLNELARVESSACYQTTVTKVPLRERLPLQGLGEAPSWLAEAHAAAVKAGLSLVHHTEWSERNLKHITLARALGPHLPPKVAHPVLAQAERAGEEWANGLLAGFISPLHKELKWDCR